jgi:succinyl-diaminopimelate desuccinylase
MKQQGERLDACVVGEPTNPEALGDMVKIGRRGSMNGRLTVHGVQGHSAYPHLADNPIHRMIKMLDAITREPMDEASEHFQASTLQVVSVDVGNPATNVIPAAARAVFNIRFNDRHTSNDVKRWLRERFDAVGARYDLDISVSGESFLTPPGQLSEVMAKAIEQVTGRRPEFSTTGGTSDARFIRAYCPVAEFGLVGQTMHKVNERVAVADIARLTDIYERMLDGFFA